MKTFKQIRRIVLGDTPRTPDSPYGTKTFTERQQEVFDLIYCKKLTYSAAATKLGITISGVTKIKTQLLNKLNKRVKDFDLTVFTFDIFKSALPVNKRDDWKYCAKSLGIKL